MNILRLPINTYRCCYNDCMEKNGLKVVPKQKRAEILQRYKVFISKRARVCVIHMQGEWNTCRQYGIESFSEIQLKEIMNLLAYKINRLHETPVPAFNVSNYDIGLSNENFEELYRHLVNLRCELKNEKKSKIALAMYLMRLRTGDFLYRLQKTFNVSYGTQRKYLSAARKSLLLDFVPLYLGFQNLTRQDLLQNATVMARQLYDQNNRVILIADATYIFYEKSGNYNAQRDTYSDQKKRNFVKPMVITTTNGLFVDIFGPFEATKNDAKIIQYVFEHYGPFMQLEAGDIFLLDRGFADSTDFLKSIGFVVKMPEFILKSDKTSQLTTSKGNASRFVTACRFAIEARNGHMKEIWKIFNKTWISYEMPNLMSDFKIGAALINKFFSKIESNRDDAVTIANRMKQQASSPNEFSRIVNRSGFQSDVKKFTEEDADRVEFPILPRDEIKKLTLGNYQINQSLPYIVEHLKRNGKFLIYKCPQNIVENHFKNIANIQVNIENAIVYLTYMYSRFRKNSKHAVYVMIDKSMDGRNGIIGHTCDCRHGLRVVGCCSHISSLIAYLGCYRHDKRHIKPVAAFMDNFFPN